VHPLRLESVAWVAERKDVLAGFFGLLACWAYVRFGQSKAGRARGWWYAAVIVLYACSLLSKPMLIMLPVLLLAMDVWPLRRLDLPGVRGSGEKTRTAKGRSKAAGAGKSSASRRRCDAGASDTGASYTGASEAVGYEAEKLTIRLLARLGLEKLPLVVLAVAATFATFAGEQMAHAVGQAADSGPLQSLGNAAVSYFRYIGRMFYFARLAIHYPYAVVPAWQGIAAGVALLVITAVLLGQARSRPWLIVGWIWYLAILLPMSGVIRIAEFSSADRFTYFPMIGLLAMVCWSIPRGWVAMSGGRVGVGAAAGVVVAVLAFSTFVQSTYWRDALSIFGRDRDIVGPTPIGCITMAAAYKLKGDIPNALAMYEDAVRIAPDLWDPRHEAALIRLRLGQKAARDGNMPEARDQLSRAVTLEPRLAEAQFALGAVLGIQQDQSGAMLHDHYAALIDPDQPVYLMQYGQDLSQAGQWRESAAAFGRALEMDPDNADAHVAIAGPLLQLSCAAEAADHCREAIRLRPDWAEAYVALARAELSLRDDAGAAKAAEEARRLAPNDTTIGKEIRDLHIRGM
jgi:Flp pilus assembly protein TadD